MSNRRERAFSLLGKSSRRHGEQGRKGREERPKTFSILILSNAPLSLCHFPLVTLTKPPPRFVSRNCTSHWFCNHINIGGFCSSQLFIRTSAPELECCAHPNDTADSIAHKIAPTLRLALSFIFVAFMSLSRHSDQNCMRAYITFRLSATIL